MGLPEHDEQAREVKTCCFVQFGVAAESRCKFIQNGVHRCALAERKAGTFVQE